jgi:quercetin dioxygenase-like cupin family protein
MSEGYERDGTAALDAELMDEMRAERADAMRGPDSPEGHEVAAAIGRNVARFRTQRSLDLAALAARTGIREDLLAALERGDAIPSLRAVWHLATGLEVPFGALLANVTFLDGVNPDFRVQRRARGRVISSPRGDFRSRVLFLEGDPRAPEVYELTLRPGCREDATPHAADTCEHITVVRGVLLVRRGDDEARLEPGDTIFFRADQPHGYRNPGDDDAVALLVISYAGRAG